MTRFLMTLALLLLTSSTVVRAQGALVQVKGLIVGATEVSFQEVTVGGKPRTLIALVMPLGSAITLTGGLAERMASPTGTLEPVPLRIFMMPPMGSIATESREYSGVVVDEIRMPTFDAHSRVTPSVEFRLSATGVTVGPGGEVKPTADAKGGKLVASQFLVSIDQPGLSGVVKVQGHRLVPCDRRLCDSVTQFDIEVRGSDVAAWRSWYQTMTANPTATRTLTLSVTKTDLATVLLTEKMTEVRPVALTESVTSGIQTARITLRPRRVTVQ